MSNLKGTNRVMVVAILIAACVFMISNPAAGKFIGYPPIRGGDQPPGCSSGTCPPPQPVNPYKPGCPPEGRCRHVPPGPPTINIYLYTCLPLMKMN
ncbi:unnamed protein product [Brassica rapa subsp. trilocularis]